MAAPRSTFQSMGQGERETIIGICGGVGPAAGLLLHQSILTHTENHVRWIERPFLWEMTPGRKIPRKE